MSWWFQSDPAFSSFSFSSISQMTWWGWPLLVLILVSDTRTQTQSLTPLVGYVVQMTDRWEGISSLWLADQMQYCPLIGHYGVHMSTWRQVETGSGKFSAKVASVWRQGTPGEASVWGWPGHQVFTSQTPIISRPRDPTVQSGRGGALTRNVNDNKAGQIYFEICLLYRINNEADSSSSST